MPTVLACLRRSVERMWPPRVPTGFAPGTRLRRPKNQWNQGPLATPQAEMCPRTANSGLGQELGLEPLGAGGAEVGAGDRLGEVAGVGAGVGELAAVGGEVGGDDLRGLAEGGDGG